MNHKTQGPGIPKHIRVHSIPRVAAVTFTAIALASLLGGCSIWPKSLSLQSDPLPEGTAQVSTEKATTQASDPLSPAALPVSVVTATAIPPVAEVKTVEVTVPTKATSPAPETAQLAPLTQQVQPSVVIGPAKHSHPGKSEHGYYVNVGLFAVEKNASKTRHTLESAGLAVQAHEVQAKDAKATRIRVGPFVKQAQAKAAAKKIHALKLDAIVVHH